MDQRTVGDLFARERRTDRPALEDASGRLYDTHWLLTSAWKAGNFLRHTGVRRGVTVGVVGAGPLPLLAFFGTALLEGATRFEPPTALASATDVRTLVAPTDEISAYELPRGAQRVGYGAAPADPAVHHFDGGLWSENPSFPPLNIDPETPLLTDGESTYSHSACLAAARAVIEEVGLETGDRIAVHAPLSTPETVVAGVLAPLLADAVIVFPGAETEPAAVVVGDPQDAATTTLVPDTVDLA